MITDGIGNGSDSCGSAIASATAGNGDATNASIVTGTTIDLGVITVAGNNAVAELLGGSHSHLLKGRLHPALLLLRERLP
jgi:hypothetical protein